MSPLDLGSPTSPLPNDEEAVPAPGTRAPLSIQARDSGASEPTVEGGNGGSGRRVGRLGEGRRRGDVQVVEMSVRNVRGRVRGTMRRLRGAERSGEETDDHLPYHGVSRLDRDPASKMERGQWSEDDVSFEPYHYVQGYDSSVEAPVRQLQQQHQQDQQVQQVQQKKQQQQEQEQEQEQALSAWGCYPLGGIPNVGAASIGRTMGAEMQGLP